MGYQDARDRIQTVLEALSITSPISQSIAKVYPDLPATIQDLPCFVMYGPSAGFVDYTMGGAAIHEEETEQVRLLIRDQDRDQAAAITRGFRKALVAAFKAEAGLGGHATVRRVRWDGIRGFTYGAKGCIGHDIYIEFTVKAP